MADLIGEIRFIIVSFELFIYYDPFGVCIFPYNFWLLYLFDMLPCIVSGRNVVGDTGK